MRLSQQSSSKESVGGTDDNLIDLSHFTGDEQREGRALFNRHCVMYAQSDDGSSEGYWDLLVI